MYEKIKRNIKHPEKIIIKIGKVSSLISDELYLKAYYYNIFGKKLNLQEPRTFNEKLQWLKLYDRQPKYTAMVDKYMAKKYVADIIGEKYIIPTYGIWEKFDDIDFEILPKQFVIKCTHDSAGLVIVEDKKFFNAEDAKKKINYCLNRNFYYSGREWPYKNCKPRIIIEKYMSCVDKDLPDYKIHCFNGEPRLILVCRNRFKKTGMTEDFFSEKWEHLSVVRSNHPNSPKEIEKPVLLEEMLELAKKLSVNIPFLRVDFYTVDGKIYFGELTFFPASGLEKYEPEEWDETFGDWLTLPALEKK